MRTMKKWLHSPSRDARSPWAWVRTSTGERRLPSLSWRERRLGVSDSGAAATRRRGAVRRATAVAAGALANTQRPASKPLASLFRACFFGCLCDARDARRRRTRGWSRWCAFAAAVVERSYTPSHIKRRRGASRTRQEHALGKNITPTQRAVTSPFCFRARRGHARVNVGRATLERDTIPRARHHLSWVGLGTHRGARSGALPCGELRGGRGLTAACGALCGRA